jgi:hypothetical protein
MSLGLQFSYHAFTAVLPSVAPTAVALLHNYKTALDIFGGLSVSDVSHVPPGSVQCSLGVHVEVDEVAKNLQVCYEARVEVR